VRPSTTPPQYLWHNDVHETWDDEKLVFLFFAYEPTYRRDAATERLVTFMESHDILTYQIYEVTAPFDILVRAWVPSRMRLHELKAELRRDDPARQLSHTLEVEEIVHHWVWETNRTSPIGDMRAPDAVIMQDPKSRRERDMINQGQGMGASGKADRELRALWTECAGVDLLAKPDYRDGVRFLILVKVTRLDRWEPLQHRLVELLTNARRTVLDPSLYRLDDHHQFLILGRVTEKFGKFHSISEKLASQINDVVALGDARTYTSYFPMPGFLAFQEQLRVPPSDASGPPPTVEELLAQPEGQRFEVKGSALTDLRDWVSGIGERQVCRKPVTDAKHKAFNSLMRAIASLLNGSGGHIVVGVLEKSSYGEYERFQELPSAGRRAEYGCLGVDHELPNDDWDEYARTLREHIETRLDPTPSTHWLKIRPAEFAGRRLCVIDIITPDEWFWVRVGTRDGRLADKFIIRVEARTKALEKREIDEYKAKTARAFRQM
jgi:hypothetical protein